MNDQADTGGKPAMNAKKKSIIDAAIRVFVDEGYENASMDRISEAAAASKRTVYNYFPGKEDLLRAVMELFDEEMRSLKKIRYDGHRGLEEQLAEFVDAEISVVRNEKWMGLIRLLLAVFISHPDLAKESMGRHAASETGLDAWMRAAKLDGKLAADDHLMAARIFSSMLGGAFTWPSVYQGGFRDDRTSELKKEIIRTFLSRYEKREVG